MTTAILRLFFPPFFTNSGSRKDGYKGQEARAGDTQDSSCPDSETPSATNLEASSLDWPCGLQLSSMGVRDGLATSTLDS